MLIRLQSKKSEPILSYNGKLLASSVDAQKEASAWVERNGAQLSQVKNVIVLGVGCGYHLSALQLKRPEIKIVAVDLVEELISFTRSQHSIELANVKFICAKSIDELMSSKEICMAVRDFYTVLSFSPAQISSETVYQGYREFLSARNINGFQFVLKNRVEMQQQFDFPKIHAHSGELLSIKTLMQYCHPSQNTQAGLLIKTLREFVV